MLIGLLHEARQVPSWLIFDVRQDSMTPSDLIDASCKTAFSVSPGMLAAMRQRSAEKQMASGIQGSAAHGIYVKPLFELFRNRVCDVHKKVIEIIESLDAAFDSAAVTGQVDSEVDPENWTTRIVNPNSGERSACQRRDVSTVWS